MSTIPRSRLVDRAVAHLRGEIVSGRWLGRLPGVRALAREYGISHPVVRAALLQLEEEGVLVAGGGGRARSVALEVIINDRHPLRVRVLLNVRMEAQDGDSRPVLERMWRDLEAGGHTCRFDGKCLSELKHDVARIRHHAEGQTADAWVIVGGMEETLAWFAAQPVPAIAIGGRCREVPIASTGRDTLEAFREACRHLTGMGHRRVVFISSRAMRHPEPSRHIEALAGELDACGTAAGPYNTPEWDETPAGLMALLENMFRLTPPTAILVEDANWLAGVLSFLARHGLWVPRDVSLVCLSHDPTFPWLRPEMAHLRVDNMEMVKRVVRWAEEIARGREDRTCVPCHAEFVPGASTGPVAG